MRSSRVLVLALIQSSVAAAASPWSASSLLESFDRKLAATKVAGGYRALKASVKGAKGAASSRFHGLAGTWSPRRALSRGLGAIGAHRARKLVANEIERWWEDLTALNFEARSLNQLHTQIKAFTCSTNGGLSATAYTNLVSAFGQEIDNFIGDLDQFKDITVGGKDLVGDLLGCICSNQMDLSVLDGLKTAIANGGDFNTIIFPQIETVVSAFMGPKVMCGSDCQNAWSSALGWGLNLLDHMTDNTIRAATIKKMPGNAIGCMCDGNVDYDKILDILEPLIKDLDGFFTHEETSQFNTTKLVDFSRSMANHLTSPTGFCTGKCKAAFVDGIVVGLMVDQSKADLGLLSTGPATATINATLAVATAESVAGCFCGNEMNYNNYFDTAIWAMEAGIDVETSAGFGHLKEKVGNVMGSTGMCSGTCPDMFSNFMSVGMTYLANDYDSIMDTAVGIAEPVAEELLHGHDLDANDVRHPSVWPVKFIKDMGIHLGGCVCGINYGALIGVVQPYLEGGQHGFPDDVDEAIAMAKDVVPAIMSTSIGLCAGTCPLFARAVDSVISNTTANILQTQWTQAPAAFNYPALISAIDTSTLCICSPSMDFANMITSATPWIKGGGQYDMEDGDAMGSFITDVLKGSSMCSSPYCREMGSSVKGVVQSLGTNNPTCSATAAKACDTCYDKTDSSLRSACLLSSGCAAPMQGEMTSITDVDLRKALYWSSCTIAERCSSNGANTQLTMDLPLTGAEPDAATLDSVKETLVTLLGGSVSTDNIDVTVVGETLEVVVTTADQFAADDAKTTLDAAASTATAATTALGIDVGAAVGGVSQVMLLPPPPPPPSPPPAPGTVVLESKLTSVIIVAGVPEDFTAAKLKLICDKQLTIPSFPSGTTCVATAESASVRISSTFTMPTAVDTTAQSKAREDLQAAMATPSMASSFLSGGGLSVTVEKEVTVGVATVTSSNVTSSNVTSELDLRPSSGGDDDAEMIIIIACSAGGGMLFCCLLVGVFMSDLGRCLVGRMSGRGTLGTKSSTGAAGVVKDNGAQAVPPGMNFQTNAV
jgi:hypothetical protein